MLLYIPLDSHQSVFQAISASATYLAKKKIYHGILAKNKIKSLRGVAPTVKAKVDAEFKRQWKVYVKGLRKNRKPVTKLSEGQLAYRAHFKEVLKKYGVTSPGSLSKEEKSKFFNEIKETWAKKKGGSPTAKTDDHADGAVPMQASSDEDGDISMEFEDESLYDDDDELEAVD